jgi:hypothetical protein
MVKSSKNSVSKLFKFNFHVIKINKPKSFMRRTIERLGPRPFTTDQVSPNSRGAENTENAFRIEDYPGEQQLNHVVTSGAPATDTSIYNQMIEANGEQHHGESSSINLNNLAFVNSEASGADSDVRSAVGCQEIDEKSQKSSPFQDINFSFELPS